MRIDTYFIFTIVSAFAIISLSIVILLSRADRFSKRSFVLFATTVSLFMVFLYFSNLVFTDIWNLFLNRGVFIIVPWMVFGIDNVINTTLYGNKASVNRRLLLLVIALSVFASTKYFIEGTVIKGVGSGAYPSLIVSDFVYWPYIILTVLPIFPLFKRLFEATRILSGFNNQRAKSLLLSTLSVFVLLIISNVIFPYIGINATSSFAPLWMLFWVVSVYYSIANQRLFGIKHLLVNLVQFLIDGLLLAIIIVLIISVTRFFNLNTDYSLLITLLPVTILLAMVAPIYTKVVKVSLQKILKINEYETSKILSNFIVKISRTVEYNEIFEETVNVVKSIFQAEKLSFLVSNEDNEKFFLTSNKKLTQGDVLRIYNLLSPRNYSKKNNLLLSDEVESFPRRYPNLLPLIRKNNIEVIARLFDNNRYLGVIVIQSREDATSYSLEEVDNLRIIISNVTISLGRSMLFSEIQGFNAVLQNKIDSATQTLKNRNESLKLLRDRERDMMDIIGHELRTPLSIIKMNLGLLELKIKAKRQVLMEDIKDAYTNIVDATRRESRLLETMISSTKVDAGRVELHFEEINILDLLNQSIQAQQELANKKQLKLNFDLKEKKISVFADRIRTSEILDNIIGNAVKYTDKGSVTIKPYIVKSRNEVKIQVIDTGIGIPKKNIPHLGSKFYRVGQYIQDKSDTKNVLHVVRPGGTGLGLYVAFGLAKAMNGDIKVDSTLGVGSTFTITLPLFIGQKEIGKRKSPTKNVFMQLGLKK